MQTVLEKWQATAVVALVVVAVLILAIRGEVNGDVVVAGLIGIANLVLGAGATAHGVRQGSKATADPPPEA